MSVVEASSGTYRSRVDGTIVLSVEIEPRYRAEALALFGMPGTPMALAAFKVGAKSDNPTGELCRWAAIRCTEPKFREWASIFACDPSLEDDESAVARLIRSVCNIESRAELDTNPAAAALFHNKIREPYSVWLKKQGVAC